MTQRDRSSPDGGSNALPHPPVDLAPLSPLTITAGTARSLWEQWFERASPAQRQHVLAQAASAGMIQAHQLPAPEAGRAASRRSLTDLLASPGADLDPPPPVDVVFHDTSLDEGQRLAVRRALATPDVALILGYPGTGKSRVVTELLRQAVGRGQRVLFLAAGDAALDRALGPLANDPSLGILRCVGAEGPHAGLPACLAGLTLTERLRAFHDHTLPAARQALADAQAAADARRQDEALGARLDELLGRHDQLVAGRRALQEQIDGLTAEVEAWLDNGPGEDERRAGWKESQQRANDACRQLEARQAAIQAEVDQLTACLRQHEAEKRQLVPLVEAKQSSRWWTGAWWKATVSGDLRPRLETVEGECRQAADKLETLQRETADLASRCEQARAHLDEERRRIVEQECSRRRADLDGRLAALDCELAEWTGLWQAACAGLSSETTHPAPDRQAVADARAAWQEQAERGEQEVAFRREWLDALEQARPGLAGHLVRQARIVAGRASAVPAGNGPVEADFDLLVVEEAHRIGDADLLNASRRARRWVLVGEPPTELPIAPPPRRTGATRSRAALPAPLFQRLWGRLHPDPRRLPTRWRLIDGRLVACLRPIAPEHDPHAQREPVFDRPEIELVIVVPPRQEPRVAEVRFPGTMSPAEAREYIYRELQELAVQAGSPAPRWSGTDEMIRLELSPPGDDTATVVLEHGVREVLTRCTRPVNEDALPWQTQALEFDRAAGWDAPRAERWVEERLGLRDPGRTAVLDRVHRACPELTGFLSGLLYSGCCAARQAHAREAFWSSPPAVQLVSLPAGGRHEPRRGSDPDHRRGGSVFIASRPRAGKASGAGLETDLADSPRPDQLPAELRQQLPPRGVVNYPEARAVVAAAEALVIDPAFRAACADWQSTRVACPAGAACAAHAAGAGPAIAVMSLFPAQVELLRLLVGRSDVLSSAGIDVEVGPPTAFAQRECLVALVSLTRSHTHLAVPFSDHPQSLLLAMTRPVARLVLFADPGTLARRSQWFGALEHLDETAGPIEQALAGQLLERLVEPEPTPRPGRTLESSRV